jgi:hypothetical protein
VRAFAAGLPGWVRSGLGRDLVAPGRLPQRLALRAGNRPWAAAVALTGSDPG